MSTQMTKTTLLTPSDPVEPAWFQPLESFAAAARSQGLIPINPDHFFYTGWIERLGFPTLHTYRHVATRKYLNIDDNGSVWRFIGRDKEGIIRYLPFDRPELAIAAAEIERGNQLCGHLRQGAIARAAEAARREAVAATPGFDGLHPLAPPEEERADAEDAGVATEEDGAGVDADASTDLTPAGV